MPSSSTPQHPGGLPWEHRVMSAARRTQEVAQPPGQRCLLRARLSPQELHLLGSCTSAWAVYWPCNSRSRAVCRSWGHKADPTWLSLHKPESALHCFIKPLSSCREGPSPRLQDPEADEKAWPRAKAERRGEDQNLEHHYR